MNSTCSSDGSWQGSYVPRFSRLSAAETPSPIQCHVQRSGLANRSKSLCRGTSGLWYEKTGGNVPNDGWTAGVTADPLPTSPNGAIYYNAIDPKAGGSGAPVLLGSNPDYPLVDRQGNLWWISPAEQVIENGKVDALTNNVIAMAYVNGAIWQENKSDEWYKYIGNAPGSYDSWAPGTVQPPVPVTLTWIGGGNDAASNPADWSPNSLLPSSQDDLNIPAGSTVNVSTNILATAADVNIENGSSTTIVNVSGLATTRTLHNAGLLTVNIANGADWDGSVIGGNTTVVASGTGEWANVASSVPSFSSSLVVDANVIGAGSFSVQNYDGKIEFMHGVGAGQTVTASGNHYDDGASPNIAQIDDPSAFQATAVLGGWGEIILKGIAADSYTYQSDVLSLYKGSSVVYTMKMGLVSGSPEYGAITSFGIAQVGKDIYLNGNGGNSGGTVLGVHP